MHKMILNYGRCPRPIRDWRPAARVSATVVLVLVAIWIYHVHRGEARFEQLTDPAYLRGKTVFQIVGILGFPDEDHRAGDQALLLAAKGPIAFNHTYGRNEHFNGNIGYVDRYWNGYCRIEIRNGVVTEVEHLEDNR